MISAYIFVFWVGAIIGSFLNVVGLRLLREESPILPRSYCYGCESIIAWHDNIPVFSWLMLGGKCRKCKSKISIQYPLVELLTGILFVMTVYKFGFTLEAAFMLFLIANFMVILVTDFREQLIFDMNSVGLIPFGLAFSFMNLGHVAGTSTIPLGYTSLTLPHIFVSALIAVCGAFVIFFILNLFSRLTLGRDGFGDGDTRLLMGIGSFLGLKQMVLVFILSFIIQAGVGIPMLVVQWIRQKAYKTTGLLLVALVAAGLPYLIQAVVPDGNMILLVALVSGIVAMICVFKAMKLAKELPSGLTTLPFGPAIVFACLLLIFCHDFFIDFFRSFLPI
jgi:prepilin signal peptidase PulO-like enzyme (type II secretory pathway)